MEATPLVSTAPHVVFRVANGRFALPLSRVDRVVGACSVTPLPGAPDPVIGIFDLHGEFVPVFSVRNRIGLHQPDVDPDSCFLIVDLNGRRAALLVDETEGVRWLGGNAQPLPVSADPLVGSVTRDPAGLILIQDLGAFLTEPESLELARLVCAIPHGGPPAGAEP